MADLERLLKEKVKQVNSDKERRDKVREWIDSYYGKVIGFVTPGKAYHLVFTGDGVSLREGDYPSCEVSYRGSEEILQRLLNRQTSTSEAVKSGQLKAWGNLNEATKFEAIL